MGSKATSMAIEVLDLQFQGRPQCVAAFLLSAPEGKLLVECGPASSRETLLSQLAQRGVQPSHIQGVLLTHIHLDHAGDAGWWAQQGVKVYVHPVGAPHLLDPSKLLASAGRIYGEHMERLWGEIIPCPGEHVVALTPDSTRTIAGLEITALDTPGHARHHLAYQVGAECLCGDVAGVRLPGSEFVSVPAPPPEFEREVWLATLDKLSALPLERLYLTHFGSLESVQEHFQTLRLRIEEVAEFVQARAGQSRDEVVQAYKAWQRPQFGDEATFDRYEQANPLFMSVDGLLRYWRKRPA